MLRLPAGDEIVVVKMIKSKQQQREQQNPKGEIHKESRVDRSGKMRVCS